MTERRRRKRVPEKFPGRAAAIFEARERGTPWKEIAAAHGLTVPSTRVLWNRHRRFLVWRGEREPMACDHGTEPR